MITRYEAATRLDIPLEMARRHGIPTQLTEAEFAALDTDPPPWLAQSRANRTGKRPVWVTLTCAVCGFSEQARPKKWWPEFSYLSCDDHALDDLPDPEPGAFRRETYGIGTRFIGVTDEKA